MTRRTRRTPLTFAAALSLALGACAGRHPLPEAERVAVTAPLAVERIAMDSALAMYSRSGVRHVVLDTMYAIPRTAPGQRTNAMRPYDRSNALSKGRSLRLGGVPRNDEAGLLLSPPQLSGDSAAITVTWLRGGQESRASYETMEYRLRRDADGTWRVIGRRQLATS
jgi:hypothetical protein